MKKIISLFQRNYDGDRLVRDEVVPGAEWVLAGEGVPTRKYDGVCTMVRDGVLYKRYELSDEKRAAGKAPASWEPADELDTTTGKQMGWIPVGDGPEDKYLRAAFEREAMLQGGTVANGTYEFLGPKSQGNVEGFAYHELLNHLRAEVLEDAPHDYDGLHAYLTDHPNIEGIVWHHVDGRAVKIKGKDFGVKRVRILAVTPTSVTSPEGVR